MKEKRKLEEEASKKRPYEKPAFSSEKLFETAALQCATKANAAACSKPFKT